MPLNDMHASIAFILGGACACGLLLLAEQKRRLSKISQGNQISPNLARKQRKALLALAFLYTVAVLVTLAFFGIQEIVKWSIEGILVLCNGWILIALIIGKARLKMARKAQT